MTIYANAKDAVQEVFKQPTPDKPRLLKIHATKNDRGQIETARVPFESDLSKKTRDAIDKICVLQKYTRDTGFRTTRSQNDILQTLDGEDLANALIVLRYGQ